MKTQSALVLSLATFVLGVLVGLFWASFKGPPPGLAGRTAGGWVHELPKTEEKGQLRSQLATLERKIEAAPDKVGLYVQAGNLLFDHEMYEQAARYYEQALELGLENPDVITDAGICYRRLGQPEKAVRYFRRAGRLDPGHANSALNLGVVLLHDLKDKKGALEAWRKYLALNPQDQRAEMIRKVVAQLEVDTGSPSIEKPGKN